jgi:hypothetical protein
MKSIENISYRVFWTDVMDKQAKEDFLSVQNAVFSSPFTMEKFKKKYENNIYGPSVIVLVYTGKECVGARALWRNDIDGKTSYQPCDTAVLEVARGRGIFKTATLKALELVEEHAFIYNFPNDQSLSGYLKMGWNQYERKRYKLFRPGIDASEVEKMETSYLNWLVSGEGKDSKSPLFSIRKKGKYYLVKKRKYNLYLIVASISKEEAASFPKARMSVPLLYSKKGYFGRGLVTVKKKHQEVQVPVYKMDTLF